MSNKYTLFFSNSGIIAVWLLGIFGLFFFGIFSFILIENQWSWNSFKFLDLFMVSVLWSLLVQLIASTIQSRFSIRKNKVIFFVFLLRIVLYETIAITGALLAIKASSLSYYYLFASVAAFHIFLMLARQLKLNTEMN